MYQYEDAKIKALTTAYICHHLVAAVYRDEDGQWYPTSHVDVLLIDAFLPDFVIECHYCEVICGKRSGEWMVLRQAPEAA